MLEMTAKAASNGIKFDGIDIGLFDPHVEVDSSDDGLKKLADKVASYNLKIGSLVAPVWPPSGGAAMGNKEERLRFIDQVRKSCNVGKKLRELGVRPNGVVRIDCASTPESWLTDPANNTKLIAETFREACRR